MERGKRRLVKPHRHRVPTQGELDTQCLKCRSPVNTMAMPRSFAAAMTSSSRTEPPGWMTARMPASARRSRPSRKGKKASEAAHPRPRTGIDCRIATFCGVDAAHLTSADAHRLRLSSQHDGIRLDVLAQTIHASSEAAEVGVARLALRDDLSIRCGRWSIDALHENAARRHCAAPRCSSAPFALTSRRFFFFASSARAPSLNDGATMTSRNIDSIRRAASSSNSRLAPMMPPNAERGSLSIAAFNASDNARGAHPARGWCA